MITKNFSYKKSGSVGIIIACGLLIFLAIFAIVCGGATVDDRTGVEKKEELASATDGTACGVPAVYDKIFSAAASGPGGGKIPSAFIAAQFLQEHGNVISYKSGYTPTGQKNDLWPEANGDPNAITMWEPSGMGALGPMQFMPGTWKAYGKGGNVQNITDAANGTARMDKANYDAQSGSNDEKLKKILYLYNHGNKGVYTPEDKYVKEVWAKYQSLNCGVGGFVAGECPKVRTIPQLYSGWCGVASAAQNIAFWKGNYPYYASYGYLRTWGGEISSSRLNKESGKNYVFTDDVNLVIKSLKNGKPVIAYTKLYKKQHIIVLTCYNDSTNIFTANDSEPKRTGKQSVQSIGGVVLSVSNLTGPYNGGTGNPNGHPYNHPEFLVIK